MHWQSQWHTNILSLASATPPGFVSYRCKYYVDSNMKASGEINDMLRGTVQGKMLRGFEELGKAESNVTLITDEQVGEVRRSTSLASKVCLDDDALAHEGRT